MMRLFQLHGRDFVLNFIYRWGLKREFIKILPFFENALAHPDLDLHCRFIYYPRKWMDFAREEQEGKGAKKRK
jgi:hypothetical protein